jgi:acyl dehydratase
MSSNIPCKDRWYEDFSIGESFTLGSVNMDAEEMLDFSTRFDPQRFHIDAEAAADTIYGSLIASGWHTGSLMMRLLTDGFLGDASQGSVGISEVTWPWPVRAGDTLTLRVEILGKRVSRSRPDIGLVETSNEMINQDDNVAMRTVPTMIIARRDAAS